MDSAFKPRYWLGAYDAWHLLLPVALAALLGWMWQLPPSPPYRDPAPPPPLAATTVSSPVSGSRFAASRIGDVEGTAEPNAVAALYYAAARTEARELGRMQVGADGRYRFRLAGFPAGDYQLQVVAWSADGRSSPGPVVAISVVPDPRPAPQPQAPRRRRAR